MEITKVQIILNFPFLLLLFSLVQFQNCLLHLNLNSYLKSSNIQIYLISSLLSVLSE
jgi:hypothetical protein